MAELVCRPADHDQWLTARRQGVTATDVVQFAGIVRVQGPYGRGNRYGYVLDGYVSPYRYRSSDAAMAAGIADARACGYG